VKFDINDIVIAVGHSFIMLFGDSMLMSSVVDHFVIAAIFIVWRRAGCVYGIALSARIASRAVLVVRVLRIILRSSPRVRVVVILILSLLGLRLLLRLISRIFRRAFGVMPSVDVVRIRVHLVHGSIWIGSADIHALPPDTRMRRKALLSLAFRSYSIFARF